MRPRTEPLIIETTDLTPIHNLTSEEEAWLRQVSQIASSNELALTLTRRDEEEAEPVVFFDERSSSWWAGRYIGEVQYQGRTLRILPRFQDQLHRWLSRIWGVRLLPSKGRYEGGSIWLWQLIARLWESRLLAAAQHGPPTFRFDELHSGLTIRGRLQTRLTAHEFSRGRQKLVSRSRIRSIDHRIGGIIIDAFENLRGALRHVGDERSWLTDRTLNFISQLRTSITRKEIETAARARVPIRYTPITEGYRDLVELSRAISRQRPFSSTGQGTNDVLGVLIDMAEVWELYVYHLLRNTLREVEVIHTGRDVNTETYLLRSNQTGEPLAKLKPDILILSQRTNRLLAVVDAKYKTTTPTRERPQGILREDLYQLAAYLSAFGGREEHPTAGLVYPSTKETQNIFALQAKNPWSFSATDHQLWFLGLSCEMSTQSGLQLSSGESLFVESVQSIV